MQKRKSFFNNELEQRFSLRKYTIGLCSVCLGFVAIGMGSQTVKADTVNGVEKSSTMQENKAQDMNSVNTDALPDSKTNMPDLAKAKPNTTPTETKEGEAGSVAMAAPEANATSTDAHANEATPTKTKLDKANPATANSNNASAQTKLVKAESAVQPEASGTSTETKSNELGSAAVNSNAVSTEVKPNVANPASLAKMKPQRMRFAKLANVNALAESKVATDNQFNFDDWTTEVDNNYLNITGYKGDRSKQIVVPNGADFAKAGKNDKNLQVEIDKDTLAGLIVNGVVVNGVAPKLSNTDGQKIVAKGNDWSNAFSNKNLHDISGLANLDTSNVTDMSYMFYNNQISDLSSLANLDTSNVTDMSYMFYGNQISDLSPLTNWNTGNVTSMYSMLDNNQISDLSPLANWNIDKVTDMISMFQGNQISNLSPLTNWNTGNVTDMYGMFDDNQISDLSPLSNWNTDKVTRMTSMFAHNRISDLSPLTNWNTGNVTSMNGMFFSNQISDLSPLSNWNTDKVTDMSDMFYHNQISNLSSLANWNTGNVTDMSDMFDNNQISDLTSLANWNVSNVTDMSDMFYHNQISNLSPLANWNTDKVTDMSNMFKENPLTVTINSQSILNKFHASAYKFNNTGTLASHSESKTFNDGSQILLDKNVVTENDSATLTFKANSLAGNTYQIKIYNPNQSIDIQAAPLPTALGTTDTNYKDGYTIITNKFSNNGSVSQDISIAPHHKYYDTPDFALYESTSGLITVTKGKEDLGSINITYQNVTNISNDIFAPYIGKKPYTNHTQNTFYFKPQINYDIPRQYSFIKSAGLTITVPDDVTIDPDTFIDITNGKTLKGVKIADNQYQVVLGKTADGITVKGLINVPADKLTNGTVHLPGIGMKYTINTYNDKVAPVVATDTSRELSVIPDLSSYHGALIEINQSKWAFDRNGNNVYDYTSQGFNNYFNGVPLEPAVSTQVTNGVETFDMPAGVNITNFDPRFNSDTIDHIDYIFTDGSKQTVSSLNNPRKAIRQMKVYFKNGIQSDELLDYSAGLNLSFDKAYPDGSPIKNFDTFKIIGSFSCDELGSANNIDVAQVMLAPTQKLTDGMMTNTDQDESNKVSNASGNFINARILNDGVPQHQGHLTNPIFYFKYNDLMVPDLSKISASYDNQNKGLGSIGLTNIDNNKIHSSIITDSTGQKFVKVQIDGEYYYVSSSDPSNPKSGFNVKIPISNTPDALSATTDWSWYILNNNDEAKTESTIQNSKQNSSQSNKLDPVTVDGNTLSVGGTGTWQIITAQGFTSGTETQGNLNGGPGLASTQDDHQQDPTHFTIYDSIINATNDTKSDLVSVANLPLTQDGKSQFDVHMTGKASLINTMTGQTYDATITYSYNTGDNNFITGDQVTDWSKVKSIKVVPNGGAPSMTSLRLVVPVEDKTVYDDVGKTIYMSTMTYGEDKTNTNYTTKDGFAVPEKSAILPIIIKPGDAASAKLTVQGQATVHTFIHYKDESGKDVYVKLADKDKTYNELQDTMKRSNYLQSDRDLTIADRGLLPTGMVINYNNPTIRNSNNTYAAGYANGAATFDKTVKYDFDGDQVIFEGAMPEIVTKTHQVKETIHYVYRDGGTAKPDKVLTSATLKQTGYKNPFTGEITWNTSVTDTLSSVDSPEITGYIADKLTVPSYAVTMDSPDKEVTVTYDADNENADFTYFDDTKNSVLKVVNKSGKSNTAIGYTTTDEINSYEKQGYTLVSDDTDGRNLNFDSLPAVDQHYMIHLKHKTESVTRTGTVTRTIHYLYDNGNTAKPDKTQTVSFNETGTKDDVTGKTTWDNDNAQTVDSVTTPSIIGYTPDKASIDGQAFKFGDKDVEVTVRYNANTQNAKITYIDDTTKTDLDSKDTSGKFGQAITFATAPADEIENYKKQGYVLVSNTFDNNKYQADNSNNVFYVHLRHDTKSVSRNDDVKMTVHYVMDDNSEAPSDNKQTLSFTENGIQDLVTKHIDWTPAVSQTFKDVVTPTMTGYTPDQDKVAGQTVKFGDNDVNVTVHYSVNTQTATITYIDDTEKKTLSSDNQNGKFNQTITFEHDPAEVIKGLEEKGYVFVSNTFDNNKYQAVNSNNVFEVHFVHGTKNVSRNDDVNMTVHYVMDDNSEAPSDNKQSLSFIENGIQDLVTKHIDWTPAVSQTFKDVATKSIVGYTPDKENVAGQTVNFGDSDINVTVHYNANMQTAKITYIDDTTKTNLNSKDTSGKFGQAITFETAPADEIASYENQGYVFVSNSFDNQKYQADNSNNVYEVHFIHGTKKVSRNDDVNMTVHYVMDDDSMAPSDSKQTVSFTENGIQDLVTKHIDWTPAESQTLKDVVTPKVAGYTPDQDNVAGQTVNFGDKDVEVTVTYHANTQTAKITYIDDTTKTNLDSKETSGKFGQAITFATVPTDEIANYKKQGYKLVSNDFNDNKYQADNSKNVFYVHFVHDTKKVSRNDDVNMTVHYVMDDDSVAPSDSKQTVNFTEDGTQDLVTKHIDWTPAVSQTFKDVATKSIVGYTPDKENVAGQTVNFGDSDINVTVHYNANMQTAKITYIDDTTKTNLDSKDTSGKFGQAITFETTPADEIENYKKQGYVLVSSTFDNNKYQADNSSNIFYVHLKHDTKDVSRSDDVNMTVHYVMDDNSKAPSDNKQTVNFTENGIQDLVTKHIDWIPAESQTLNDVTSPVLTGYTADIKTANGKSVNFGDNDINVTVTYHANTQNAKITYIDDTTKTDLKSKETSGKFGQAITFETTPTVEIENYKKQGYVLVSSTFDNNKYQADNSNNVFEVHLKHGTKDVSRNSNVNMTVHYVMDDNSEAPSDNKQALSFTENGIQDLVTKHIDWTPAASQTFKDVVTPKIAGYTPDQDKVAGSIVNFGDKDVEATVTYSPNVQIGHINYIDDDTKKTLTRDDFSGRTNEHEDYTSTDRIQEFENKGYELVSNDYPDDGFNFDNNDRQDQVFNVHFKHGTVTVTTKNPQTPNTPINPDPQSPEYPKDISNTNSDVKRTIDYKFKDDKTAQPTVKDSLHFERTVVIDKVTGKVLSDTWTQSQNFNDIQTPAIQGYTPDRTVVSDKNIGYDHQDIIEHVVYSPDVQHMTITYIDDTTGETLHTDNPTGLSDQDAKYTTSDTIKKYEDQHYKLVSDSTKGRDLIFDHDDDADQTYEVHFVHGKHAIDQTTSPKQTIHYVYSNGLARQGKAADDSVQQLSFKRDGYNDEVTGIDHWNAWTPANSQYKAVDSPVIQGYTPDKLVVEKSTVNPTDQDIEVTVTYSADKQAARVIYIDKTTNITLVSKDLSGKSDEDSEYNTKDTIGQYQSQHYVLAGDETDGNNVIFDHDDQQDQTYYVYFVHDTQKVNRQSAVTSTIDYKFEDGKTAQPTVTQTKYFSENGIKDLVTNKITWDDAKPQKFEDVATKPIVGYTPDKDNVAGQTVKFGDQDTIEHIVYHNNMQKAVITYVDDVTNQTLASDSQDGKFDYEVKFNNNPSDVISGFEKSGYKLVSSNFKAGTKYKADNKQNEFIVHLTHNMQSVSRQDKVTETIHYVYEDGSKSQPNHEQTLSFNETGSKDLVTGKITWDEAKPQKFEDVATPKMTGYTPDTDNVVGSTVKFGDDDVEVTVHYTANAQTATITYIDDTEKKTLNSDQQNGKFNQVITFEHDPAEVVKGLEEKGYELVSDDFKPGIKYQADNKSNSFEVHLKHKTESVTRNGAVTRTIHYLYDDGNTAKPDKVQTVSFNETGTKDDVTGKTTWDNDDAQTVDNVITPSITGYTPDKDEVAGQTFKFGDKDVEVTVRYNANAQTATITYIDDTEKKTLGSDKQNGKFNQVITFEHDPAEVVKDLEEKGYKLASDNFKPGIKYQADNKSNNFEVHLVHTYEPVETSQTITETVHYIDANGNPVAPDHVGTVVVKVTGTRDKVTNSITWNTPSTGHFDEVISPVVSNMTPDKKLIPSRDVRYGDSDITENVVYTLDEMPGGSEKPNNSGNPTSKTPGQSNKPGDSTPKTPKKPNKSGNSTSKNSGKSNKSDDSTPKTPEKSNNSGKEVSKQRGMIAETTIPEKHVDNHAADNQVSAKSTAKQELPQTGATTSAGVWAGLASMIASLGLLGASKKRKKN